MHVTVIDALEKPPIHGLVRQLLVCPVGINRPVNGDESRLRRGEQQTGDRVMTSTTVSRVFRRDEKTWTVKRCATSPSRHEIGLHFFHDKNERFLVFSRGALPSDRELQAMSDEVLNVLLDRAGMR